MAKFRVSDVQAVAIRRAAGITVTFVNQSTVDVYLDKSQERLNRTLVGAVPQGTLLAKNGGQLQWPNFPGVLWSRAATATQIEILP